jgi:hypothetical protein
MQWLRDEVNRRGHRRGRETLIGRVGRLAEQVSQHHVRESLRVVVGFTLLGPLVGYAVLLSHGAVVEGDTWLLQRPDMMHFLSIFAYIYGGVPALVSGVLYGYLMRKLPRNAMNLRVLIGAAIGAASSFIAIALISGGGAQLSVIVGAGAGAACALAIKPQVLM